MTSQDLTNAMSRPSGPTRLVLPAIRDEGGDHWLAGPQVCARFAGPRQAARGAGSRSAAGISMDGEGAAADADRFARDGASRDLVICARPLAAVRRPELAPVLGGGVIACAPRSHPSRAVASGASPVGRRSPDRWLRGRAASCTPKEPRDDFRWWAVLSRDQRVAGLVGRERVCAVTDQLLDRTDSSRRAGPATSAP